MERVTSRKIQKGDREKTSRGKNLRTNSKIREKRGQELEFTVGTYEKIPGVNKENKKKKKRSKEGRKYRER